MATKNTFATINDIMDAITPALGDYANDFDIEGIAREISHWENGKLVADVNRPDFWDIAAKHDTTETTYRYFAYVARMALVEEDERYVELDEDANTGSYYMEDYFDTEAEAVAFVKDEVADYIARELDGIGYKVIRTRRGLDSIEYCEGAVERHCFDGDDVIDYGDNPGTEHHYDGYCECSLPDEVRDKAMSVQVGYHRYLDYESDGYDSLADELAE